MEWNKSCLFLLVTSFGTIVSTGSTGCCWLCLVTVTPDVSGVFSLVQQRAGGTLGLLFLADNWLFVCRNTSNISKLDPRLALEPALGEKV